MKVVPVRDFGLLGGRQMKTLLVAVRAEDRDQASVIAAHEFRIYLASETAQALSMLSAGHIDGVVCGVHFNDGDPFTFRRLVRKHPQGVSLPFVIVRAAERGRLHAASYVAVELACAEEGIPYIDSSDLISKYGLTGGYAELRKRIRDLL
jgi:hypothetical protein